MLEIIKQLPLPSLGQTGPGLERPLLSDKYKVQI